MLAKIKNWLKTDNHLLFTSITALILIGVLAMYCIGPYFDARIQHEAGFLFGKSIPFFVIGYLLMLGCSRLSKKWLLRISWGLGIVGLMLMIKTIVSPIFIMGSARYVKIGTAMIDPFVITLPAYIVLMSHWLSKEKTKQTWITIGTTLLTLFIALAAFMAPYVFIAQVYLLLFLIMGFKARKNMPWVFYTGMAIFTGLVLLMLLAVFHWPHIQHKIMNHGNYAVQLSVQAVKSSALVGSTQESLALLPKMVNGIDDFVLSSLIAKFGYLMGLLVLALYGFVAKGLTNAIRNTKDQFARMLATGTLGLFAFYILMALAVALGVLATAAYWPFISFGGTLFLTWCILFGFVMAINNK